MKESAQDIAEDIRDGKKVLVVDDILDSGKTIAELIEDWAVDRNTFDIAAMIWNTAQGVTPNYYGRTINRNDNTDWVTFWWETRGE
jgi:hypoxanthine phosphoribosyltransferase